MNRIATWSAAAALALSPLALAQPTTAAPRARIAKAYTVTAKANTDVADRQGDHRQGQGPRHAQGRRREGDPPAARGQQEEVESRPATPRSRTTAPTSSPTSPRPPARASTASSSPASKGIAKGISKAVEVEVYRWEKLANRQPVATNFNAPVGVNIGAEYFGSSLATATVRRPRRRSSTPWAASAPTMRATYALTDESVTGSIGTVRVTGDGAVLVDHALAVGTVVAGRDRRPDRRVPPQDRRHHHGGPAPRPSRSAPPRCSARADAHLFRSGGHDRGTGPRACPPLL